MLFETCKSPHNVFISVPRHSSSVVIVGGDGVLMSLETTEKIGFIGKIVTGLFFFISK